MREHAGDERIVEAVGVVATLTNVPVEEAVDREGAERREALAAQQEVVAATGRLPTLGVAVASVERAVVACRLVDEDELVRAVARPDP